MKDNKLVYFNVFGVVFITVLILYLVVSMGFNLHLNTLKAKTMLDSISETVIDDLFTKTSASSKTSNFVKLSNLALSSPSLKSLIISDENGESLYVFAKNPGAVIETAPAGRMDQMIDSFKDTAFSTFTTYRGKIYQIKAVFTVLQVNQFASLLKYAIAASLVFIIIAFIFLISSRNPEYIPAVTHYTKVGKAEKDMSGSKTECISKISNELKRSASFDQDMSLVLVKVPSKTSKTVIDSFEKLLHEAFTYSDLIYRYTPELYAVIIPNADIDKGIALVRDFDQNISTKIDILTRYTILYGISSRNGRLVDGNVLFSEASAALKRAGKEEGATIIGFRPDPAKYREFLTKNG